MSKMKIIKAKVTKRERGKAAEAQIRLNSDSAGSVNVQVENEKIMGDYERKTSNLPAEPASETTTSTIPQMETPKKAVAENSLMILRTPSQSPPVLAAYTPGIEGPPVLTAYTPGIEEKKVSALNSTNISQKVKKYNNAVAVTEDDGKFLQQKNVIDIESMSVDVDDSSSCLQALKTVIATNHKSQIGKEIIEEVTNVPIRNPIFSIEVPAAILKLNGQIQMDNKLASNSKNNLKKRVAFSDKTYICYFSSEIYEKSRKRKISQTGQRIVKRFKKMASTINNKLNEKGNVNEMFLNESKFKFNEVLNDATNLLSTKGFLEPTEEIKIFRKRKDTPIKPSTAADQIKLNRSIKGRRLSFLNNSSIESLVPKRILRSTSASAGRKNLDKAKSLNGKKAEKERLRLLKEKEKSTSTSAESIDSNELEQNSGLTVTENDVDLQTQPSNPTYSIHTASTSKIESPSRQTSNAAEENEESRQVDLIKTFEKENCSNSNNEKTDDGIVDGNSDHQNETTIRSQHISETGPIVLNPILNLEVDIGDQIVEKDLQLENKLVKVLLNKEVLEQNFLIDVVLNQYKSAEELITFVKNLLTKKDQSS